jgi:hypothetical protein
MTMTCLVGRRSASAGGISVMAPRICRDNTGAGEVPGTKWDERPEILRPEILRPEFAVRQ